MEKLISFRSPVLGALGLLSVVASFLVPDAPLFNRPESARILFWHLPCPMAATALLIMGTYFASRTLMAQGEKRREWDVRALAALELGTTFVVLTLLTGMIFGRVQWGSWWNNDPRQTSYLMVLGIYVAYFALRGAFADRDVRAQNASAYALTAVLPMFFLSFVFPRLPQVEQASLHPSRTIQSGLGSADYRWVTLLTVTTVALMAVALYRARVRAGLFELRLGHLETDLDDASAARVARPVPLHETGGGAR